MEKCRFLHCDTGKKKYDQKSIMNCFPFQSIRFNFVIKLESILKVLIEKKNSNLSSLFLFDYPDVERKDITDNTVSACSARVIFILFSICYLQQQQQQ
jgi:hypothetical protein